MDSKNLHGGAFRVRVHLSAGGRAWGRVPPSLILKTVGDANSVAGILSHCRNIQGFKSSVKFILTKEK